MNEETTTEETGNPGDLRVQYLLGEMNGKLDAITRSLTDNIEHTRRVEARFNEGFNNLNARVASLEQQGNTTDPQVLERLHAVEETQNTARGRRGTIAAVLGGAVTLIGGGVAAVATYVTGS